MRLDPDPLPLRPLLPLRPFDEERAFAVVRLRPPLELRPFDELLLRLDELLLRLEEPRLPLDDDLERPPDELRPEADFDLRDDALRLRELDEERLLFTSPSSISPRQDPLSSSSISM